MKSALIFGLFLALGGLSACTPRQAVRSEVVTVETTVFAPIPADLTSHGTVPESKGLTCGSAVEVARARKDFASELIAKLDAIRRIEGTPQGEAKTCSAPAAQSMQQGKK